MVGVHVPENEHLISINFTRKSSNVMCFAFIMCNKHCVLEERAFTAMKVPYDEVIPAKVCSDKSVPHLWV